MVKQGDFFTYEEEVRSWLIVLLRLPLRMNASNNNVSWTLVIFKLPIGLGKIRFELTCWPGKI